MYSGMITFADLVEGTTLAPQEIQETLKRLENSGQIQERKSLTQSWELSPPQKKELIEKFQLETVWEHTGKAFYPNGEHGEITNVLSS
jgi:hypothetical protein